MLKLKPYETCIYSSDCPHKSGCYGLNGDRAHEFTCGFISFENGKPIFKRDDSFRKTEFELNNSDKKILHG